RTARADARPSAAHARGRSAPDENARGISHSGRPINRAEGVPRADRANLSNLAGRTLQTVRLWRAVWSRADGCSVRALAVANRRCNSGFDRPSTTMRGRTGDLRIGCETRLETRQTIVARSLPPILMQAVDAPKDHPQGHSPEPGRESTPAPQP